MRFLAETKWELSPEERHHLEVLRVREGETFEILCADEIATARRTGDGYEILSTRPAVTDAHTITLYQGYPKGTKLDEIVEKSTELGVDAIVPVYMARSVVRPAKNEDKKRARRIEIARSATKQSRADRIPEIREAVDFETALASQRGTILAAYEDATEPLGGALKCGVESEIALWIGPEGGWEPHEIERIRERGGRVFSLGRRILRTETAGPATISILRYLEVNHAL